MSAHSYRGRISGFREIEGAVMSDVAINGEAGAMVSVQETAWARWGVAAGVVGMLSWVAGTAMIPLDAKLQSGAGHLAQVLREHAPQLYVAALLAVTGGVLLVAMFAVFVRLTPEGGAGGGLLRVALAGCVITQTVVATGGAAGLVAVHSAVAEVDPELTALAWRGVSLSFLASAVPTLLFTITGVLGLERARLSPRWVGILGWISAAAHVVIMFTVAQQGAFTPDGPVGALVPITTVLWILALSATLPARVRRRSGPVS